MLDSRARTRRRRRRLAAAAVLALLAAGLLPFACIRSRPATQAPAGVTAPSYEPRPARVLLVEAQPSATLASAGGYALYGTAASESRPLDTGASLADAVARPTATGLAIGGRGFPCRELRLAAEADGALAVNGIAYRGELLVRRVGDDQLSVINVLPVERYLYSVLGSETYAGWPDAALDAQAIVARSYTLWQMERRRGEDFDLYATVMDQSYLGTAKEDPRLRAAVDRTEGLVLLYQMKLFRCYYHSTCGGHTEAVESVFPDPPILPLSGVVCAYCGDSKRSAWQKALPKAELAEALRQKGMAVKEIASLEVTERTASGRAREIAIETSGGTRLVLPASDFRLKVGPQVLPSAFFEIREEGDGFRFDGRGWGHGVGMCQWGSKGMAEKGYSASEILLLYYPGAQVRRLYTSEAARLGFHEGAG